MSKDAPFRRFLNAYQATATLVLNTILLGVMLLGAIAAISAFRNMGRDDFGVIYSMAFDKDSYRLLDGTIAAELGAEFDRMGEHQSFTFNPWTTFMVGPFTGTHLNVEAGPVLNHRRTPAQPDEGTNRKTFTVWAFGGSTMFGWGLSDETTVAAQLQSALQTLLPERRVVVVNYGQPYWFSSVELAALPALLREAEQAPDVALFLDGLNDTVWGLSGIAVPPFADRAHAAWEHVRANLRRDLPWISVNNSFPALRVVDLLRSQGIIPRDQQDSHFKTPLSDPVAHVVETYRENRTMIASLLVARDVKPVFVLQPVPFWGEYKVPGPSHGVGAPSAGRDVYELLVAETTQAGCDLIDLSNTLLDVPRPYLDPAHYSDAGAKILAEAIAAAIVHP